MEYTLENTYTDLEDLQEHLCKEIEELATCIENNKLASLNETFQSESMKEKQCNMVNEIRKQIPNKPPAEYPILRTSDIYIDMLNDLRKEVFNARDHVNKMQEQLQNIEKDIAHLESKKNGFDKMREMYLTSAQTLEVKAYDDEVVIARRLFQKVRGNLLKVIELLFPENKEFKNLLIALTTAYDKGGDDVYINVISESLDCIKYLLEADIVVYHPNDKNKIRMVDLL